MISSACVKYAEPCLGLSQMVGWTAVCRANADKWDNVLGLWPQKQKLYFPSLLEPLDNFGWELVCWQFDSNSASTSCFVDNQKSCGRLVLFTRSGAGAEFHEMRAVAGHEILFLGTNITDYCSDESLLAVWALLHWWKGNEQFGDRQYWFKR